MASKIRARSRGSVLVNLKVHMYIYKWIWKKHAVFSTENTEKMDELQQPYDVMTN